MIKLMEFCRNKLKNKYNKNKIKIQKDKIL